MPQAKQRYKVIIRCKNCGEKYILRGRYNEDGGLETGFKRCVCGNESSFDEDVSLEE